MDKPSWGVVEERESNAAQDQALLDEWKSHAGGWNPLYLLGYVTFVGNCMTVSGVYMPYGGESGVVPGPPPPPVIDIPDSMDGSGHFNP